MEGMLWGVAAMVVKDAVKNPYLKGRDYERNVRQVYRDVDNLRISIDQVKMNCTPEDMEAGEHAAYIKRAQRQMKASYRILKKHYPRKAGLSRIFEHAATPGAEMHLLDIGKEANQTAKGLGDLLAEIRFAKIGRKDEPPPPPDPTPGIASPSGGIASPSGGMVSPSKRIASPRKTYDLAMYEHAVSDRSSSSIASDDGDVFDRALSQPSSAYTPSSSASSQDRSRKRSTSKHSTSSSHRIRRHSTSEPKALPSSSPGVRSKRPDRLLENSTEREHALDNLQIGIDSVLLAPDEEHEDEAMEYMEHALAEVLRLQKTQGFSGSSLDEDLGDAVEDLDESMKSLLTAKNDKETKYAMRRMSHALEDVDYALGERSRHKAKVSEYHPRNMVVEPAAQALPPTSQLTRGKLRRQNTDDGGRNRRYSMYK